MAELKGHKSLKSKEEISKDISSTQQFQRKMPEHFIDFGERVEAVWSMLMQQGTSVVGLFGMGGVGTQAQLL